ncbi:MAG: hypothetical protein HOH19_06190 [Kordiimonadaceae bacterium]|nr:hypothetical protein [Kordiimonadaceae bacterium]
MIELNQQISFLAGVSLWQSIIVLLIISVVFKMFKKTTPEEKSWSWTATLICLAMLPMMAFMPGQGIDIQLLSAQNPVQNLEAIAAIQTPVTAVEIVESLYLPWFLIIWGAGSLVSLLLLIKAGHSAATLRRSATAWNGNTPPNWPKNVEINVSAEVDGPMALGILRPTVLVPLKFTRQMEPRVLNPLLFHELAHIKRHDNVFYLIEILILALYWWNPLMYFAAKQISEEREKACDDRAAVLCGDQLLYAKSLLTGAREIITNKENILAMGAYKNQSSLSKRVTRLMDEKKSLVPNVNRTLKYISVILVAIMTIGLLSPRLSITDDNLALAQESDVRKLTKEEEDEIRADVKRDLENMPPIDREAIRAEVIAELENMPELDYEKIGQEVRESLKDVEEIDVVIIEAEMREGLKNAPGMDAEKIEIIVQNAIKNIKPIDIEKIYINAIKSIEIAAKIDKEVIIKQVMEGLDNIPELDAGKIAEEAIRSINGGGREN